MPKNVSGVSSLSNRLPPRCKLAGKVVSYEAQLRKLGIANRDNLEFIAEGAFGRVYGFERAGHRCVVKFLFPNPKANSLEQFSQDYQQLMRNEVLMLHTLSKIMKNSFFPSYIAHFTRPPCPCHPKAAHHQFEIALIMTRVEGYTLARFVEHSQGIASQTVGFIGGKLLQAVAKLESHQCFYGDFKTQNIVLDNKNLIEDGVKLVDPGSVRNLQTRVKYDTLCTRQYLPPECYNGKRSTQKQKEIFSLGLVLAEAFLGYPIISVKTTNESYTELDKHYKEIFLDKKSPRFLRTALLDKMANEEMPHPEPHFFLDFIMKMVAYQPEKRFSSAQSAQYHPLYAKTTVVNVWVSSAPEKGRIAFFLPGSKKPLHTYRSDHLQRKGELKQTYLFSAAYYTIKAWKSGDQNSIAIRKIALKEGEHVRIDQSATTLLVTLDDTFYANIS